MGLFDWLFGSDDDPAERRPDRDDAVADADGSDDHDRDSGPTTGVAPRGAGLERSVGIETVGGVVEPVLERGVSLPAEATRTFTTAEDGQESVAVRVHHGDAGWVADDELVGAFTVTGIPPRPAGDPRVDPRTRVEGEELILSVDAGAASISVTDTDAHVDRLDDDTVSVSLW
jgi:molecular chaperone DnaK (HSP70)